MKIFGATIIILLASLALCHGGVMKSMKEEVEMELAKLIDPLMEDIESLKLRLNHEAIKRAADLQYFSTDFVYKINMDACSDLAISLELGGEVALNASITAYTLGSNVTLALWDLLNCPQWNPVKAGECLYGDLSEIKSLILSAKPLFLSYRSEVRQMASLIEHQFVKCVGKGTTGTELPPARSTIKQE